MSEDQKWPSDWTRAILAPCVLRLVGTRSETYGYQIVQDLVSMGMPGINGGTIYPVLNRMEAEGRIESEWREGQGGPGRKFYRLTDEGSLWLHKTTDSWHKFAAVAATILMTKENSK